MASFQVSLTNPITDLPDITISSGVMTITDHSNYGESVPEAGHARSNFTDFYKVLITLPTGTYVLFSSLGDGDDTATVPAAGDPQVDYTYLSGDGQYFVTIYTLPTYDPSAAYLISTTPYVYYATKVYRCLQSGTGQQPDISPTYWIEVTDIDLLPTKYRVEQRTVVYVEAKKMFARKIYNANVLNNKVGENWEKLLRDPDFVVAVEALVGINAIPILLEASRFSEIDTTINLLKQLASVGEVL
jgi:hypothetical protein